MNSNNNNNNNNNYYYYYINNNNNNNNLLSNIQCSYHPVFNRRDNADHGFINASRGPSSVRAGNSPVLRKANNGGLLQTRILQGSWLGKAFCPFLAVSNCSSFEIGTGQRKVLIIKRERERERESCVVEFLYLVYCPNPGPRVTVRKSLEKSKETSPFHRP